MEITKSGAIRNILDNGHDPPESLSQKVTSLLLTYPGRDLLGTEDHQTRLCMSSPIQALNTDKK